MNKFFSLSIAFLSLVIAFGTSYFVLIEQSDTYFVMNIGRHVLENGLPHVDPFTIHENLKLVAQQWLSGIFFWEAYKFWGVDGLRLANFVIGTILVVIHWRLCLFVSGGNKVLSLALTLVISLFAVPSIVSRPHVISAAILLSEVFFLEKFTRTGDFKFLLPLPVLSILLINFHAAMWLMAFVVSLPFFFVKSVRHVKFLLAAMAAVFLCGFINPYGLDAMTYVLHSYGVDLINRGVIEMRTPTAHDLRGKIFYLSAAFIIFSLTKFKVPWRYIFLSGGIMFMTVMHARNYILYYFLATFPLAYAWRDFNSKVLSQKNLSLLMVALIIGGIFSTMLRTGKVESGGIYTDALKFLLKSEHPENISLYVNQGYGGLAGMFGIKYYIDSRAEVFLPANNGRKNILKEYYDFTGGKIYYADFFARYDFTHIIIDSKTYFLYNELSHDKNFRVIYESERVKDYDVIRCKIFVPKNGD